MHSQFNFSADAYSKTILLSSIVVNGRVFLGITHCHCHCPYRRRIGTHPELSKRIAIEKNSDYRHWTPVIFMKQLVEILFACFRLLGLCNNYGYVIMLSAAHDILADHENNVSSPVWCCTYLCTVISPGSWCHLLPVLQDTQSENRTGKLVPDCNKIGTGVSSSTKICVCSNSFCWAEEPPPQKK